MAKEQVIGIDKFRTGLALSITATRNAMADSMRKMAAEMVDQIKAGAPTKTGALKESVRFVEYYRPSGPAMELQVGNSKVRYAAHVEYGTSKEPAHPFVRPVVERLKKRYPGQIEQAIAETWSKS